MKKKIETIVRWMVANDFMSGWCGDDSEAFIQDRILELLDLHDKDLLAWLKGNELNIRHLPEYKEAIALLQ